jgi:signal transduction histidine kinase
MEQTEVISFIVFGNIILLVFIAGVILFVIQYRKRKAAHEKEKTMIAEKHTKELLKAQLEIQQQTMQHIGREIHDNVGQKLTLASLYAQQLSFENKAPHINDKIENIGAIINESLSELRQLSKSLTDDFIAQNSIIELINRECQAVTKLQKTTVEFMHNSGQVAVSYQSKNILLRIVQEFLQNSIKHAECKNILIKLAVNENEINVMLSDDGKGFNEKTLMVKGIGLSNMKKRTQLLGGNFNLTSAPGSGTQLHIILPC